MRVGRLFDGASREGRERGALLHRWLQQVEWLADFEGAPEARDEPLLALGQQTARAQGLSFDEAGLRGELRRWRSSLAAPATRALLSRPTGAGLAGGRSPPAREVWRERRFAVEVHDAEAGALLLHGSFDRVVLEREGGRLVAATIIDFKTDRVPASGAALEQRVAHYAPQMHEYRRALAALTGLPPEAIACRLLFLEADAVCDVPGAPAAVLGEPAPAR